MIGFHTRAFYRRAPAAALAGTREPHPWCMDWERLPRRMLSAWAPHARPVGAPRALYLRPQHGQGDGDVFNLDHARWPELAADPAKWRTMLQSGEAPPSFQQPPAPAGAAPMPISHPLECAPGVLRRCALTQPSTRRCEPRCRLRVSANLEDRVGSLMPARLPHPRWLLYIYMYDYCYWYLNTSCSNLASLGEHQLYTI